MARQSTGKAEIRHSVRRVLPERAESGAQGPTMDSGQFTVGLIPGPRQPTRLLADEQRDGRPLRQHAAIPPKPSQPGAPNAPRRHPLRCDPRADQSHGRTGRAARLR